jgi:3'-5' exoribonuclease
MGKMKNIQTFREGDKISAIYFCKAKTSAVTKNGKPYDSAILQDKTGTIDAKIWDPHSLGIDDFDAMDYVDVVGDVINFNGVLQLNVKRVRKAAEGEFDPMDYLPSSEKDVEEMYAELVEFIRSVNNQYLHQLLAMFFLEDEEFIKKFKAHSAAKSVHHSFMGGLLEHTLSVTKMCSFYAEMYPVIQRDLLITAAIFHDIGKTKEIAPFPMNDYTDDGNLLGHIVIGSEMIGEAAKRIANFPERLLAQLKHCILAHHGELEYGSPKKPSMIEAVALNLADNADAKLETMREILAGTQTVDGGEWLGYNRFFENNIRRTTV